MQFVKLIVLVTCYMNFRNLKNQNLGAILKALSSTYVG